MLPFLGKRPIYEIQRADLLDVLARIERRKVLTVAEKCRTWFNQLFRYALVRIEGMEQNPASDLDVAVLPRPPVHHHPFLRMVELPTLLAKLRCYRGKTTKLNQPCLRGIEGQSEPGQALLQLRQKLLSLPLRPETHHAVVRVTHDNHIATGIPLAPLPCPQIQHVVKIDIRQQRRYHCTLGSTLGRSHPASILHYTRLKPLADKSEHAPVCNPVSQKYQHPFMVDLIKERRDIRIQYPVYLLTLQRDRQRIQRIVLATSRSKPIREP